MQSKIAQITYELNHQRKGNDVIANSFDPGPCPIFPSMSQPTQILIGVIPAHTACTRFTPSFGGRGFRSGPLPKQPTCIKRRTEVEAGQSNPSASAQDSRSSSKVKQAGASTTSPVLVSMQMMPPPSTLVPCRSLPLPNIRR